MTVPQKACHDERGFTLVGLMATLAIIGTLTATSVPVVRRVHISSNEAAAQGALEALRSSFEAFRTLSPNLSYPATLQALSADIDAALAAGQKNGYDFTITESTANTYEVQATPTNLNVTGERSFILDESGEIREVGGTSSLDGLNLADHFNSLSWRDFKYRIVKSQVKNGNFSLFWEFTNNTGRLLKEAIMTIERMRYMARGLPWSAAKLVADGLVKKTGDAKSNKAHYYQVGDWKPGAARVIEEKVAGLPQKGGWSYGRQFKFYDRKAK